MVFMAFVIRLVLYIVLAAFFSRLTVVNVLGADFDA
jgi:hypothetical protein